MDQAPKVAVAVFIRRDGKILLGKRKGKRGDGHWGVPGGRLEMWEKMEDAARREIMEETGYEVADLKPAYTGEETFKEEGVHYVTNFFVTDAPEGEPQIMEPEKCEKWDWFAWDELPSPMLKVYDNMKRDEFNPFDH